MVFYSKSFSFTYQILISFQSFFNKFSFISSNEISDSLLGKLSKSILLLPSSFQFEFSQLSSSVSKYQVVISYSIGQFQLSELTAVHQFNLLSQNFDFLYAGVQFWLSSLDQVQTPLSSF
ncbi:hypothetical protein TTHERM_000566759 (macronuclear) [Tetrahymena thermophila SB210]|uniref:Uncharacterized protein n=1 Tax=Tetrahymena thermophila (strain SB210) TaxID=312017 RepID=W7XHY7_TETTS|nr:hypothetical protein TTHERM_000566759 [Tetrahymena thermophila SB210]EWS72824.1 hypothetical protein TTHERM_000566759 [Tetrahymena thermophila SB210]|eukprot:XP_012654650.1 hypothetical protein TTHERM_000566759 [Tetrahymena thermophila SB210]